VEEKRYTARGIMAFYPANRVGDDVEVYADESRQRVLETFHFLRQQSVKQKGQPNYCLADFVASKESGLADYIGGFAVTTGIGVDAFAGLFEKQHDDYNAIMAKALADRLAEAFAEWMHREARRQWGYGLREEFTMEQIIGEEYRGIRPAPGYPACPDHTEKWTLFRLLEVTAKTGIELTESLAMTPASSVCGLYFGHPDARYFAVGKIGRDQLEDYQKRKGMPLADLERWLAPIL
jgi:5-methyltetrahydrofolate--homocysteine methyltransferase